MYSNQGLRAHCSDTGEHLNQDFNPHVPWLTHPNNLISLPSLSYSLRLVSPILPPTLCVFILLGINFVFIFYEMQITPLRGDQKISGKVNCLFLSAISWGLRLFSPALSLPYCVEA